MCKILPKKIRNVNMWKPDMNITDCQSFVINVNVITIETIIQRQNCILYRIQREKYKYARQDTRRPIPIWKWFAWLYAFHSTKNCLIGIYVEHYHLNFYIVQNEITNLTGKLNIKHRLINERLFFFIILYAGDRFFELSRYYN